MLTFLPHSSTTKSIDALIPQRNYLLNQIREAKAIITSVETNGGFRSHPAVLMWEDYLPFLKAYYNYATKRAIEISEKKPLFFKIDEDLVKPPWMGDFRLHATHQSKMKDSGFNYPDAIAGLEYYWPVRKYPIPEDEYLHYRRYRPYLDLIRDIRLAKTSRKLVNLSTKIEREYKYWPLANPSKENLIRHVNDIYLLTHPGDYLPISLKETT